MASSSLDESTCSLPTTCQTRIEKVLRMPCNQTCADCAAEQPQWASLLLNIEKNCLEGLGAVVCQDCAVHHHYQLGQKRTCIKYLRYSHEWAHRELDVLEYCGNDIVNEAYEATLTAPQEEKDEEQQAKFIKKKYKKCRYTNPAAIERAVGLVASRTEKASEGDLNKRRSNFTGRGRMGTVPKIFNIRGSTEKRRSKGSRMDMSTASGVEREDSSRSLCSELHGSSTFSLCDVANDDDFYNDCEKCTFQRNSDPGTTTGYNWDVSEHDVPTRSTSDPVAITNAVASILPNRCNKNSDRAPCKHAHQNPILGGLLQDATKNDAYVLAA